MKATEMLTVIHASAHDLSQIGDGVVQCIVTSPPYFALRQYAGDQDIEWPTVEYAPMPGLDRVRVQGCEPGCEHVWGERVSISDVREETTIGKTRTTDRFYGDKSRRFDGNHQKHSVAQYCERCGGWKGPLGQESTPEMYTAHMVLCAREWRRVLRPDGTLWFNISDSFAGSWGDSGHRPDRTGVAGHQREKNTTWFERKGHPQGNKPVTASIPGLNPKNMIGIPWRVAFALQADGWWLRSDPFWVKRNAMPSSQQDRPSSAKEYIFLFAKSEQYFYDQEAVKVASEMKPQNRSTNGRGKKDEGYAAHRKAPGMTAPLSRYRRDSDWFFDSLRSIVDGGTGMLLDEDGDPLALVVNPSGYREAHYAVFSPKLIEPLLLASTSARGACPLCGAPWKRVIEKKTIQRHELPTDDPNFRPGRYSRKAGGGDEYALGGGQAFSSSLTIGWLPTCGCYGIAPLPDLPGEPEKPEGIDLGAPETCTQCEGVGTLTPTPMFPEDVTQCPKCKGMGGRAASDEWLDWQTEYTSWADEYQRIMENEIKPLLAQVGEDMEVVPCIVLDPFAGSGTTGQVAAKLGLRAFLGDLSTEYLEKHVPQRTTVQVGLPRL